jgi:putative flippase GtrA
MSVLAPQVARVAVGPRFGVLRRQAARFVAVGAANTALFLAVYLLFRTVLPATVANVLASALTTVTGTNANGRVTFAVAGRIGLRHQVESGAVTVLGLVITTGAVGMVDTGGSALAELVVLVAAGVVAGTVRFVLLRTWVFATSRAGGHTESRFRTVGRWSGL